MYDIENYYQAESVKDAVRLLNEHPDARIISGAKLQPSANGFAPGTRASPFSVFIFLLSAISFSPSYFFLLLITLFRNTIQRYNVI